MDNTVVRIYNPRRGRAHLVETTTSMVTLCGIWTPGDWLGTGGPEEHAEAHHRRLCNRCSRRAVWRAT